MDETKRRREERAANNQAMGIKVDVDFQALVETQRENVEKTREVRNCNNFKNFRINF